MSLRVIPVLDLKAGSAVHASGGDRAHYGPLRSRLHEGPDPVGLAGACRDRLGLSDLYLADLDAIDGAAPDVGLYGRLRGLGLRLWVDAGVRDRDSLPPLLDSGIETIVVGLETIRGPGALAEMIGVVGPDRLVFSLDLKAGRPLTALGADWGTDDPRALAESAIRLALRRLLVLDLAQVGSGRGLETLGLVQAIAGAHPGLEITVGGGVAGPGDLTELARSGVANVLIGSALHDGRIDVSHLSGGRFR